MNFLKFITSCSWSDKLIVSIKQLTFRTKYKKTLKLCVVPLQYKKQLNWSEVRMYNAVKFAKGYYFPLAHIP